ncbi:unnamed protein product [Cladocopium goreaui]|uniref:Uncharacterized protein n=1 Tax=Cladocopium goreaui TaxID=2562237 RepID=A0A9P1FKZ6_9DINO|nr:unnamed protein product [Cladocopium goreaui]
MRWRLGAWSAAVQSPNFCERGNRQKEPTNIAYSLAPGPAEEGKRHLERVIQMALEETCLEKSGILAVKVQEAVSHMRMYQGTITTLSSLATNLLREMRNNTKVSQKFLQLGGVDAFQLVLCGDEQAVVQLPTPFHPELQVVLCLILAEVVLLGDAEVAKKRGQRKMAMSFFTAKAEKNSRMGMLAKMTRHNAKSEQAVELLFKALDGATRRCLAASYGFCCPEAGRDV